MGLLQHLGLAPTARLRNLAPLGAAGPADGHATAPGGGPRRIDAPDLRGAIGAPTLAYTQQEMIDYSIVRGEFAMLLAIVNAHPDKAVVQADATAATTALAQADALVARGDYAAAKALLDPLLPKLRTAKGLLDDATKLRRELAIVIAQTNALKRVLPPEVWNPLIGSLNQLIADLQSGAVTITAAATALEGLRKSIAKQTKDELDEMKKQLAGLEAQDAAVKTFLGADLVKLRTLAGEADAAHKSEQWSRFVTAALAASELLWPLTRFATRRAAFEKQRKAVVAALAALKKSAPLKDRAVPLDKKLAEADALASRETMEIEQAQQVLSDIANVAAPLVTLAPVPEAYEKDRPAADSDLKALRGHAAAARLKEQIDAVTAQLAAAARLADQARSGSQPIADWSAALTALRRARADLDQARAMGDGLAPTLTAQAASTKPKDVAGLTTALQTLRDLAAKAAAAGSAALVAKPLATFKTHADKADAALAKGDGAGAAAQLRPAGEALLGAQAILAEHAQFAPALAALQARKAKLDALPTKASIQARIDAVQKAIDGAIAQDKLHNAAAAMALLRRGEDAAALADQADSDRRDYEKLATPAAAAVAAIADAKVRAALQARLADAKAQADAFQFGAAKTLLKKVELQVDTFNVKAMVGKSPPDPSIAKVAARMVANGGAKEVDDMLQAMPDSAEPGAAAALVAGRHGVTFEHDKSATSAAAKAESMRSIKLVGKTLSKIPNDLKNNPSLKSIKHFDTTGEGGGAYKPKEAGFTLKGRTTAKPQEFGAKQKHKLNGVEHAVLPRDVDPACAPVDTVPVPVLSWAALHESAHGIDDSHGFMNREGHKPEMGGWKVHGTAVQEIADVVGPEFGLYANAAEKKYVLEKILGTNPPAPPAGSGDWALRKKKFDDWFDWATSEGSYMVQSLCEKWTIKSNKRIYHEAYGRVWVSYDAAARKKGLTGYQFRAPGEWFAELYAGYKSGKLGSRHPAREWLKKISK